MQYICAQLVTFFMCGIAGIISNNPHHVSEPLIRKMTDSIEHRGPDGEGIWISGNGQVGLGHRRLSIIDLSTEANQPMHYMDRYTLVFNGEIYNYIELREGLVKKGYAFRTQSDTEVLLALYHENGEACLNELDGMFAFLIYDKQTNRLFGARDRFGEKPLFYHYIPGKLFVFGSEMKCLWAAGVSKTVNHSMLYNYLSYGFISNPKNIHDTFYSECQRAPHSYSFVLDVNTMLLTWKSYYSISLTTPNTSITEPEAMEKIQALLQTSISRRLRSDVPVGSSLSGGLDSSILVRQIDELNKDQALRQNTFSAVFPGFEKDEAKHIHRIVESSRVNAFYVTPTDQDLIKDLDRVAYHQEEPFGSASIYVQYRVMELAKQHKTTVLLDGQAADEIFAGYHVYFNTYFQELKNHPASVRELQMKSYQDLHAHGFNDPTSFDRIKNKATAVLGHRSEKLRYWYQQYRNWKNPVLNYDFQQTHRANYFPRNYTHESLNAHLLESVLGNELFHLLRYADRNSMAHGREVRLPFLFHELVEFIFSLPPEFKLNKGWTKYILRKSFEPILPPEICWRKDKIGYEPPQKKWMEEKAMQDKIMDSRSILVKEHILNKQVLHQAPQAHGANDYALMGWSQLMAAYLYHS